MNIQSPKLNKSCASLTLQRLLFLIPSLVILTLLFAGCTKDSDDSDSSNDTLETNACGQLDLNSKVHTRIVNGTVCEDLSRSPVVRVVLTNAVGLSAFCSGTMITDSTVVTAAHCFLNLPSEVIVLVGATVETSREYTATNWIIHPDFAPAGDRAVKDIAIIRLATNTDLPTIPVMTETEVKDGEIVSIFGYGKDENGNFDFQDLRSGEMLVNDVDSTHIIAKFDGEGSNTCQGDSGGPLLSSRTGRSAIAGITSSGLTVDCLSGDTSFFTNLTDPDVKDFLKNNVPNADFR